RPMRGDDLAAVAALDGEAFGAGRAALLAYLHGCAPCAWVAEGSGGLAGFVLGRPGVTTLHLGPLVARDAETATALAARALGEGAVAGMPVSIDVPDGQSIFRQRLRAAGFAPLRPFTRMLRHEGATPGAAGLTFAIAGPELG
ncbi:MAG TPA: hypothetical protein VFX95_02400, partial [Caulobacteraceae bacterium]|nr:hypothetical protein [Caulobacteraceae bacterium]